MGSSFVGGRGEGLDLRGRSKMKSVMTRKEMGLRREKVTLGGSGRAVA
jgi:hypothetical protein